MFYNDAKKKAIELLKAREKEYNELGQHANDYTLKLYNTRKSAVIAIDRVEIYVNALANSPKEFAKEIAEVKFNIKEFSEAIDIEKQNASDNIKGAGFTASGIAAGGVIASLGPTAAMAVATTFGTASTGTAIASLSGAAATNAALAWLGGGALAAGGGGMTAGSAFLAMAGPVGWAVAGIAAVGGGAFISHKNKEAAEKANEAARTLLKHITTLQPKLKELICLYDETSKLKSALKVDTMINLYPKDYLTFDDNQKKALAALINNVRSMGVLINKRIS